MSSILRSCFLCNCQNCSFPATSIQLLWVLNHTVRISKKTSQHRIAAIIELALENWADGGILLGILFTNATIRSAYVLNNLSTRISPLGKVLKGGMSKSPPQRSVSFPLLPKAFPILKPLSFLVPHSYYETTKAGDAVAALKASLKPLATVKRDGKWQNMDASLLVPGDLVLLGSGSAVPADCIVNHGSIDVDQARCELRFCVAPSFMAS